MIIAGLLVAGYLFGSIPFGLIIAKIYQINLRDIGSGNPGATNMFRAAGWVPGSVVLILDALKAFIPTYMAMTLLPQASIHILVGLTTIIGHSFPIFAKFKGGKGAASGLGILLALSPIIFCILFITAFLIIYITRYVSVATLAACILAPALFYVFNLPPAYTVFVSIISILIIYRHKSNIKRLMSGTENKI